MSARHSAAAVMRARHRVTARAMVLAVCLTAVLIAAIFPLRTYVNQRSQISKLNLQTEMLEKKNTRLEARIQQLHDPAYLEQLARQCLGMVKPGEVSFVIVPKHGAPKPLSC